MEKLAKKLKPEELAKYEEVFRVFDTSGKGAFGVKELKRVMLFYGMSANEQQLYEMVAQIDTINNGLVTFEEFLAVFLHKLSDTEKEDEMREAFRVLDTNGNGFLPVPQLKRLMTETGEKLSPEEWDQLLSQVSMDDNEDLNYEELIAILMSTQNPK
ncbi:unnamed protein product [Medioppia subpectinata]|uniref:EF-hand domain-containing protein n=1 Tax=Medioppia subpectinata TaxID=1979941 RepID=A0A7R9KPY8_9ACAR|nr:unnamed protein product [Medioppia subpectinata]CAG2106378.1 unnamed protein product [Medioppia subpectinata]